MIGSKYIVLGLVLAHYVVGDMDLSNNIYLKHMISARAAEFIGPQYLPPTENLICHGGEVCVNESDCINGYFSTKLRSTKSTCSAKSEVCCQYKPKPTPIPCESPKFDCVSSNQCINGEISIKGYSKKIADQCFAPEVCCRIPIETTVLKTDGYHIRIPEEPLVIERVTPSPFVPQPSQHNVVHVSPTPTVYVQPRKPRPSVSTPKSNQPLDIYLPPATTKAPARIPLTTPVPTYLPPATTQASTRIPVVTPLPTILPSATTKAPTRIPLRTPVPTYLPPATTKAPARIPLRTPVPTYLPPATTRGPDRGEAILALQIFPGRNSPNPPIEQKCAAALLCTPIEFCTKEGVISKTRVSLNSNEELFRVPLTECTEIQDGVCCRDPDYVDPWPTNLLASGRYDPTLFQKN